MEFMKGIGAVVFDLDGTLYQDDVVCYDLIRCYTEGTPYEPMTEEIIDRARDILQGRGRQICGSFAAKCEAKGTPSLEKLFDFPVCQGLPQPDRETYFDRSRYSYIGDSWTLGMFLAHRMGFYGEEFWSRFHRVRQQLLNGPGRVVKDRRITGMLEKLRSAGIVLLLYTNSTHQNSSELLKQLDLLDKFDELAHSAGKPGGLTDRLRLLGKNYSLDYDEILLVGDQGFGDLYPGYCLGTRTLLTTPYRVEDGMEWSARVRTIGELVGLLTDGLSEKLR